jgi:hypothetical protein
MLTAEEFNERMERVGRHVVNLAATPENPLSLAAADLLRTLNELHAEALQRMLTLINSGGEAYRSLREQFMQDDLIRSMLLYYGLHPVDLRTRVIEAVGNLRPLVESYGGLVSISNISSEQVTLRLEVSNSSAHSPATMLKDLLEHAILVAAPDVSEIRFDDRPLLETIKSQLPIIQMR